MKRKLALLILAVVLMSCGAVFHYSYTHLWDNLRVPGEVSWVDRTTIEIVNLFHPGLGCARCGREWVNLVPHEMTTCWLGLYCSACDPLVTPEDRWGALDEWKHYCIYTLDVDDVFHVLDTEFVEWPRGDPPYPEP